MSAEQPELGVSGIGTDRSVGTERDVLKGPLSLSSAIILDWVGP